MIRAAVAFAVVSLVGFGAMQALAQPVAGSAHHATSAAHYNVRIRRDEFGVPHVLGKTDADAAYGLGFAQSEDDFVTVQDSIMTARGHQAMLKGPDGVPSDTLVALLNVQGVVAATYGAELPPHMRQLLEG